MERFMDSGLTLLYIQMRRRDHFPAIKIQTPAKIMKRIPVSNHIQSPRYNSRWASGTLTSEGSKNKITDTNPKRKMESDTTCPKMMYRRNLLMSLMQFISKLTMKAS